MATCLSLEANALYSFTSLTANSQPQAAACMMGPLIKAFCLGNYPTVTAGIISLTRVTMKLCCQLTQHFLQRRL